MLQTHDFWSPPPKMLRLVQCVFFFSFTHLWFLLWQVSPQEWKAQYRSLSFNIKDVTNPDFRRRILTGEVQPDQMGLMTADEMASDVRKEERWKMKNKGLSESVRSGGQSASTDQFKCGRCGQRKTTYYQLQTRSADEPMTTYVTCVHCGKRWKFC